MILRDETLRATVVIPALRIVIPAEAGSQRGRARNNPSILQILSIPVQTTTANARFFRRSPLRRPEEALCHAWITQT